MKNCEGLKKDNSKCEKNGTEFHNDKYYCKIHLKQIKAIIQELA